MTLDSVGQNSLQLVPHVPNVLPGHKAEVVGSCLLNREDALAVYRPRQITLRRIVHSVALFVDKDVAHPTIHIGEVVVPLLLSKLAKLL